MDFPHRPSQRIATCMRLCAGVRKMTAVKEELTSNPHAKPFKGKRVNNVLGGTGVGIKSVPNRRPEVRNDFGSYARALLSRCGFAQSYMNVVPFKQRILAVYAL